jgi:sec-independent protein translocase protein TatC
MVAFGVLGSGVFYTFPLVIWMLVGAGLISVDTLKENRKQLFLGLIIVTAVLTPDPTPFSMLLMSIPFYILYEITIQVLSRTKKGREDPSVQLGIQASRDLLSRQQDPDT